MKKFLLFSVSVAVMLSVSTSTVNAADIVAQNITTDTTISDGDNITGTQTFTSGSTLTIGNGAGAVTTDAALDGSTVIATDTNKQGTVVLTADSSFDQGGANVGSVGAELDLVDIYGNWQKNDSDIYTEEMAVRIGSTLDSTGGTVSLEDSSIVGMCMSGTLNAADTNFVLDDGEMMTVHVAAVGADAAHINLSGTSTISSVSGSTDVLGAAGDITINLADTSSIDGIKISTGTVTIGNIAEDATLGAINGNTSQPTGEGNLIFNSASDINLDNSIGAVNKLNDIEIVTGTNLVSNVNIYSENIDVNDGGLTSTGGTISSTNFNLDGGLDITDTMLNSTNGIIVDGASNVTMSGNSTSTGGFKIQEATTLDVNGSASTGSIIISAGKTLSMSAEDLALIGTIDGVSAGSGTLNITEDLTLDNDIGAITTLGSVNSTTGTLNTGNNSVSAINMDIDDGLTSTGGNLNVDGVFSFAGHVDLLSTTVDTGLNQIIVDGISDIHLDNTNMSASGLTFIDSSGLSTLELLSSGGANTATGAISLATGVSVNIDADADSNLGTIDGVAAGDGIVRFNNSIDLDNTIGAINALDVVEIYDTSVLTADQAVNANEVKFLGDGTLIASDAINADIVTNNGGVGTFTVEVAGSATGNIGSLTNYLNTTNINGTINSATKDIYSNNINIAGAYTSTGGNFNANSIDLAGDIDLTDTNVLVDNAIYVSGDSDLALDNTVINNGFVISDASTLTVTSFVNNASAGTIDGETAGVGTLQLMEDFSVEDTIGGVNAISSVDLVGPITLTTNSDVYTGSVNFVSGDGSIIVGDGTIYGDVVTATAGLGNVTFSGDGNITGSIGSDTNYLNSISYAGAKEYTLSGDINAEAVNVINGSTMFLSDNINMNHNSTGTYIDASTINLNNYALTTDGNFITTTGATIISTVNSLTDYGNVVVAGGALIAADTVLDLRSGDHLINGEVYTLVNAQAGNVGVQSLTTILDSSNIYGYTQVANTEDLQVMVEVDVDLETGVDAGYSNDLVSAIQGDLEDGGMSGDLVDVVDGILTLPTEGQEDAFKKLNTETNGARFYGVLETQRAVDDLVRYRVENSFLGMSSGDVCDNNGVCLSQAYGLWGDVVMGMAEQSSTGGYEGYESSYSGFSLGFDTAISDYSEIGVALSYAQSTIDGKDNSEGSTTEIDTYTITGYGTHDFEEFSLDGQISYGMSSYASVRDLTSLSAGTAAADYDGSSLSIRGDLNKEIVKDGGNVLIPSIGLAYSYVDFDSYQETGSSAALEVETTDYTSVAMTVGAEYEFLEGQVSENWFLEPGIHAYWSHEFLGGSFDTTSRFVNGSSWFTTTGADVASDMLNLGFDLEYENNSDWSIDLNYDADIKNGYLGHRLRAEFRKDF